MILLFLIVLGATVGSFLNVCISRLPQEQSIVFPPSHCPDCNHRLSGFDLFPVFSFLWLRGKCRYCGKRIAFRYLLVEILTAACFSGWYYLLGFSPQYFYLVVIFSLLLVVIFTDLETEIIPDEIIIWGLGAGLAWTIFIGDVWGRLLAGVVGYIFFWTIAKAAFWYYKKEAVGGGDLKLAAMLGVGLGMSGLIFAVFFAYLFGAIVGLGLIALKIRTLKDNIPFGPFLALGAMLFLLYSNLIS